MSGSTEGMWKNSLVQGYRNFFTASQVGSRTSCPQHLGSRCCATPLTLRGSLRTSACVAAPLRSRYVAHYERRLAPNQKSHSANASNRGFRAVGKSSPSLFFEKNATVRSEARSRRRSAANTSVQRSPGPRACSPQHGNRRRGRRERGACRTLQGRGPCRRRSKDPGAWIPLVNPSHHPPHPPLLRNEREDPSNLTPRMAPCASSFRRQGRFDYNGSSTFSRPLTGGCPWPVSRTIFSANSAGCGPT